MSRLTTHTSAVTMTIDSSGFKKGDIITIDGLGGRHYPVDGRIRRHWYKKVHVARRRAAKMMAMEPSYIINDVTATTITFGNDE